MLVQEVRPIKKKCKTCGKYKLHEEMETASWRTLKNGERKHYRRRVCKKCWYWKNARPKRDAKIHWYKEIKLGLCCENCGYDRIPQAIEFHHLDPSTKVDNVSNMVYNDYSIKTILKEIAKCTPLCVLCHAEETHHDSIN